jgi:glucosamine--fructose-6-phosphate aminotransferase (isomerizing)
MSDFGQNTTNEIFSQPEVWQSTLQMLASTQRPVNIKLSEYDQVIFTGCGSPYYLSQWAARIAESSHSVYARAAPASDLLLFPSSWLHKESKTLLVAISRSAETSETLRVVETFQSEGYGDTLVITCYPNNRLTKLASEVISVPDGQESSVVQTRSFTSMMLATLWWLLHPMPFQIDQVIKVAAQRLLDTYLDLASQIGEDQTFQQFFFLGSGAFFGLASEAMLKMKEMALCHSEAFHFLEIRHGPKSIVDGNSLVIGLLNDDGQSYELSVLSDMRDLGAHILVLTESSNPQIQRVADDIVVLASGLPEAWRSPLYLPFLQLTCLRRALAKNIDPDNPANLNAVVFLENEA